MGHCSNMLYPAVATRKKKREEMRKPGLKLY